jgi:hypothetical protein
VFPFHTLPFGFWLIVMDPRFISCDYSAQKILLCLHCCGGRVSVGRSHTHFYAVQHCSRIVFKASDEFQPLTQLRPDKSDHCSLFLLSAHC